MHNISQILGVSLVVILALLAISVSKVTFAALKATLSGHQFDYKFDKTRLPRCGRVILTCTGIYFAYALMITGINGETFAVCIGVAAGFSVLALPFTTLACLLSVCYVPRNLKNKRPTKSSNKSQKDSWIV